MSYDEACDRGYDGPPPGWERRQRNRYRCSDGYCGATDCSRCYPGGCDDEAREEDTTTSKVVTARKARYAGTASEIRPGDRVRVTTGFSYVVGGPRLKYNPRTYRRVSCGPNWTAEEKAEAQTKYRYTWNW